MILSLDTLKTIYAQETEDYPIILLEIYHAELGQSLLFSTDPTTRLPTYTTDENIVYGTVSNGREYIYCPMEINLPSEDETAPPATSISVSNVGREMVAGIRSLRTSPKVDITLVLASDADDIEGIISGFVFKQIDINRSVITGTLELDTLDNEMFCYLTFTPNTTPGLFK
jgi:hypothetical protein